MISKNENRLGYKKTKAGWIPKKWGAECVSGLADIGTGAKDTKDRVGNGKYLFFVRSQKPERIDSYSYDGTAVLTAGDGVGTGKVFHFIEGKFDYHQRVYKISDFAPHMFPRFFFEYFRLNFIRQVRRYSAKGSVDSVRMEMIADMFIPLPPLREQEAIAGVLECWDKAIRNYERKIEKKRNIKKGLMQRLLSGKQRLPGFSGEWKKLEFHDAFAIEKGTKSLQIKTSEYFPSGKYPVVDQGQSQVVGYTDEEKAYTGIPVVVFGDHTRIVKWIDFPFVIGADGTQLIKTTTQTDLRYGYYLLSHIELPSLGYSRHLKLLKERAFTLPTFEEQQAIADMLSSADNEISGLEHKLTLLREQKKFLLNNLVTGSIRLPKFKNAAESDKTNGDNS